MKYEKIIHLGSIGDETRNELRITKEDGKLMICIAMPTCIGPTAVIPCGVIPQLITEFTSHLPHGLTPSHFCNFPIDSILFDIRAERVARHIMLILVATGNTFRKLPWDEYKAARIEQLKAHHKLPEWAATIEKYLFNQVVDHCASAESAQKFSPEWKK